MTDENIVNQYPDIKQSWGIVGLAILSMIVFGVAYALFMPVLGVELSFLVYYVLSMGSVFWFVDRKRQKKTGIDGYNFHFGSFKMMVLVSVGVLGMQFGIISPIVSLLPMPEFMRNIFIEFARRNGVFSFVAIVIVAPILEELIFRGIILDGLLKRFTPAKSILVSSILFGVVHLNPWQFISALIIGIFSGWVYYKTRRLTLSILIHSVNNLAAFASMYFIDAEVVVDMSLVELYGGVMNFVIITLGAICVTFVCLYFLQSEMMAMDADNRNTRADVD